MKKGPSPHRRVTTKFDRFLAKGLELLLKLWALAFVTGFALLPHFGSLSQGDKNRDNSAAILAAAVMEGFPREGAAHQVTSDISVGNLLSRNCDSSALDATTRQDEGSMHDQVDNRLSQLPASTAFQQPRSQANRNDASAGPAVPAVSATMAQQPTVLLSNSLSVQRQSWFKEVFGEKAETLKKALAPLWKTPVSGGQPQRLTEGEYDLWLRSFEDYLQANSLQGFMSFTKQLIVIGADQKPKFSDAFSRFNFDSDAVKTDRELHRAVLMLLSRHVWTLPSLPTEDDIEQLQQDEIFFQFRHFISRLQKLHLELRVAATPPGANTTLYSDVFDCRAWCQHPLRAIITIVLLGNKMSRDLTGSALAQHENLIKAVEEMTAQPTISILELGTWLDRVKHDYDLIIDKNAQIKWTANNQLQSKLYELFAVLCRRAAARSTSDYKLTNAVELLQSALRDQAKKFKDNRPDYEDFHHTTLSLLNEYLPSAAQKRQIGALQDAAASTSANALTSAGTSDKRPRIEASSTDLVAAITKAVTQAFVTHAMPTNPAGGNGSKQRGQQRHPGRGQGGRAFNSGGGRQQGPQQGRQRPGGPWQSRKESNVMRRMCENCGEIGPDHFDDNCPNPRDPDIASKLEAHKRQRVEARKKAARQRAQQANKRNNNGQQGSASALHSAHLAGAEPSYDDSEYDPTCPLADYACGAADDVEHSTYHDSGYSAVHAPVNSNFRGVPSLFFNLAIFSAFGALILLLTAMIPSLAGLPGFVLQDGSIFTTIVITLMSMICIAVGATLSTWMSSCTTPAYSAYKFVPRQFAVVLMFLCLGFALAENAQGFAFTSHHNMTADERDCRIWVDSACTKSLFRNKDLLINIRKLPQVHEVRGLGNSRVLAEWQGDYPLVIRDCEGQTCMYLITGVMISEHSGANLLGTNCLQAARLGFNVPPHPDEPASIYTENHGRPGRIRRLYLPKRYGLWEIPDSRPIGLAEIPQSCFSAITEHTHALSASHQLRALTPLETWHFRMNHAHPSKLAVLSRHCIGIKQPLADVRNPCHSCQDSNATRNVAPPPSLRDAAGVWNVDLLDMGEDHLSLAGFRYISIFVIASSRFMYIELHKTKDGFLEVLQRVFARAGCKPKILRSDNAGEYFTEPVNRFLLSQGIKKESSNSNEQCGNGRVETLVNAVGKGIRVSLYDANLPPEFWGFAAINFVDVYNHLPHSALKGLTPWEAQHGTLPDVSWFRPFGCRVTVFRGRDHVAHHKLAPRGEPCVYVGLGFYSGHKGWLCWSPRLKQLFCTRNCRFDETFMPMRTHDQRVLGFYDTTPRLKMLADQYGDPAHAHSIPDELLDMPLPFEPEEFETVDDSRHQQPFFHAEGNHFMDATSIPNIVNSTTASGGSVPSVSTTTASGGPVPSLNTTTARGGSVPSANTSTARGGSVPSANTATARGGPGPAPPANAVTASGGSAPSAASVRRRAAAGGGANSGFPIPSSAGEQPAMPANNTAIGKQYLGDDFDWQTLGPRRIKDVNNFELTEWLIGHGIFLTFDKDTFNFPHATEKRLRGYVYDTTSPARRAPNARVNICLPSGREEAVTVPIVGERHTIRTAVEMSFPDAIYMDDLRVKPLLGDGYVNNASSRSHASNAAAQDSDCSDNEEPEADTGGPAAKKPRNRTTMRSYPGSKVAAFALSAVLDAFNITTPGTKLRHMRRDQKKLIMRNDTEGASFVAFTATLQVCLMAAEYGYNAAFLPPEPRSQRDARLRSDSARWLAAEKKEIDTLWKMGTFQIVDRPAKYDPLPLQFVYKLKVKDGDFNNCIYKARLVVRGNLQYEHEYGDTYAPTAKLWVVRTLAALAAQENMTLKKFDLTGAFLVADMDRDLYVEIPGYGIPDGKAILLKKALYGGRSSGALYAKEISTWLKAYGFKPTSVDETLFRLERNGGVILLSLYVDDGMCATNNEGLYQKFISDLASKYHLSDQGTLDWHLGMKFTHDKKNGTITIDQKAYIESVAKRFGLDDCKVKDTPMIPHSHLSKADCPEQPDKALTRSYQQLIGSLMYIACGTRPDIAYAVSTCAQFMSNPGPRHMEAAKRIVRYLRGTSRVGLTYSKQPAELANRLFGYVDADHASDADDRKSVGGYVLMLNGAAVSWASRKIKVVALSSFESEWYSASVCGCEVTVVRRLLEEIGFRQDAATKVMEDNAACIYSSMDTKPMNPRSKHIDTRVWKLKEFVKDKIMVLVKIDSEKQVADNLTKPLPVVGVQMAREIMSGAGCVSFKQ